MARISLIHATVGDILVDDVIINKALIFGSGTVLTEERIELLKELKVQSVDIQSHQPEILSESEILENIDERFEFVKNRPFMNKIESWIIEKISNSGTTDETTH
ncbi:hypothetical protein ACFL6H_01585 [Candidatus Latescibacterota bacterium]